MKAIKKDIIGDKKISILEKLIPEQNSIGNIKKIQTNDVPRSGCLKIIKETKNVGRSESDIILKSLIDFGKFDNNLAENKTNNTLPISEG